jgi:phage/plasmid-associated DNA primase
MTNNRPRVQEDSMAIWRRLLLVLFDVTIPEHEQDRNLERKLRAEQDGILARTVAGATDYLRGGLRPPADVLAETAQYRDSENTFSAWLSECTEKAPPDYGEKANELLHSFNAWAKSNRAQPLTKMSMAERLKRAGLDAKKRMDANYYLGIRLPDSESGQLGFEVDEEEHGDHGDVCKEMPTRAHAHAQSQESANVTTVSTGSTTETAPPLTPHGDEQARLKAELQHLEDIAATGKIQHALPSLDNLPPPISAEAFIVHGRTSPELEDDTPYTTEQWHRDDEGYLIGGDA